MGIYAYVQTHIIYNLDIKIPIQYLLFCNLFSPKDMAHFQVNMWGQVQK